MRKPWSMMLLSLLAMWGMQSCKPIEKVSLEGIPTIVKMEKGPSMARYPIYEIKVYENRIAVYEGKRYSPKLGIWVKKLEEAQWSRLQAQLKSTNIWQYPEFYRSQIPDLPLVKITQYDRGTSKTVSGKESRPPAVRELEIVLESIANQDGWVLKEALDFGLPNNVVPNQLRIQLRPGVYASSWVYRYAKQNMQILAELPEKSNYWLVGYNPTITFPKEMEQLLSYDDQVMDFAFNKVDGKNRK